MEKNNRSENDLAILSYCFFNGLHSGLLVSIYSCSIGLKNITKLWSDYRYYGRNARFHTWVSRSGRFSCSSNILLLGYIERVVRQVLLDVGPAARENFRPVRRPRLGLEEGGWEPRSPIEQDLRLEVVPGSRELQKHLCLSLWIHPGGLKLLDWPFSGS